MNRSVEEKAADWGRGVLIEAIASLELLLDRSPAPVATVEVINRIYALRTLVGASNSEDFIVEAKKIAKLLGGKAKLMGHWPYLAEYFYKSIKDLKNGDSLEDFMEAYAESIVLNVEEIAISEKEVKRCKESILNLEDFSNYYIGLVEAYPNPKDIKLNLHMSVPKLKRKLIKLDITMSKLRILSLLLGVDSSLSVRLPEDEEQ